MGILLKEHIAYTITLSDDEALIDANKGSYLLHQSEKTIKPRVFKIERKQEYLCFECNVADKIVELRSSYYVGIDWLTGDRYIQVEPKLNTAVATSFERASNSTDEGLNDDAIESMEQKAFELIATNNTDQEVDIIAMLTELMSHPEISKHTDHLILIDWEARQIPINQKQDLLTPFLIVRFLKLLQGIVRKGLKKSYYKVQENLRNMVKGKILVGQQIKQNVFKNRFTDTVCKYQVFGTDNIENRFLKKVFLFCAKYIENNTRYFKEQNNINWIINYVRPSLEPINDDVDIQEIKHLKYNSFFKEYKEAIKVGQQILKRFAYNINKVTADQVTTPPFWIDMPKMFELYIFSKFLKDNPDLTASHFNYQFSTYGNSLDFLICIGEQIIVVDTKYKLHYNYGHIHQDIRQVAGYARLKKVRDKQPKIVGEIPCLIIYPNSVTGAENLSISTIQQQQTEIKAYHKVYKLGISLPLINL